MQPATMVTLGFRGDGVGVGDGDGDDTGDGDGTGTGDGDGDSSGDGDGDGDGTGDGDGDGVGPDSVDPCIQTTLFSSFVVVPSVFAVSEVHGWLRREQTGSSPETPLETKYVQSGFVAHAFAHSSSVKFEVGPAITPFTSYPVTQK